MLENSGRLAGKVAVVTGAGRGIGRAIALAFAAEGASVVLAARTAVELEATAALLAAYGVRYLPVPTDVSVWESVQELVHRTLDIFDSLHILVNNASIQGCIGPLVSNDPQDWAKVIQTNLAGAFYGCRAALPHMIEQRRGRIINLSGGGATAPRPNFSAYAASKAALVRLTETLAEEVRSYNIQVNAIAPGAVNSRMLEETLAAGAAAGEKAQTEALRQLHSGGTPPELAAQLAVFLACEASQGLTGRLVAAPYDGWEAWDANRIGQIMAAPWLTLRRMDAFTLKPFLEGEHWKEG